MNTFWTGYLIVTAIMMLWTLTMAVAIYIEEEGISAFEILTLTVLGGLIWPIILFAGFAHVVFSRKTLRKHN